MGIWLLVVIATAMPWRAVTTIRRRGTDSPQGDDPVEPRSGGLPPPTSTTPYWPMVPALD